MSIGEHPPIKGLTPVQGATAEYGKTFSQWSCLSE